MVWYVLSRWCAQGMWMGIWQEVRILYVTCIRGVYICGMGLRVNMSCMHCDLWYVCSVNGCVV